LGRPLDIVPLRGRRTPEEFQHFGIVHQRHPTAAVDEGQVRGPDGGIGHHQHSRLIPLADFPVQPVVSPVNNRTANELHVAAYDVDVGDVDQVER